jgi:hypothetical protein
MMGIVNLYRRLLYIYPAGYRCEFAEEMCGVFRQREADVHSEPAARRIAFCLREFSGLFSGALRERIRIICGSYEYIPITRFNMRPEFRFPRSTVCLMSLILAAVVLAITKATTIEVKHGVSAMETVWPSMLLFLVVVMGFVCSAVAIVWGILFAMRRTGMHRLSGVQPWQAQR